MGSNLPSQQSNKVALKDTLVEHPELVLDDPQVMQALVHAFDLGRGDNIVDMRAMAMQQLETRLDRLENNHRMVVSTAFENMSGMQQIHKSILELGHHNDSFCSFMETLGASVPQILRIKTVRLIFETYSSPERLAPLSVLENLHFVSKGALKQIMPEGHGFPMPRVLMRAASGVTHSYHGKAAQQIGSEAFIALNLGENSLPALLLMGAEDPETFACQKGTALIEFLADFIESQLIRFLRE